MYNENSIIYWFIGIIILWICGMGYFILTDEPSPEYYTYKQCLENKSTELATFTLDCVDRLKVEEQMSVVKTCKITAKELFCGKEVFS
jgi:hypothetical protein